ncbi:MAG: RNA-dependent DNA polymerase [Gemmatimonadales bacterium]|nr:RNA-dependent DNA polymerase [Gemmatimonadales bacterium]NIP08372.1 RNA-dependent DNA polymerase [Gemmatimonadales bacterium]
MKRVGGLFDRIWSYDNLVLAARRAQVGKRYRPEVLRFNYRREDELHRLSDELRRQEWRPQGHRHFQIFEPKLRWISAAPYRDRVVHHALCNVIEPVLDRRLIFDCWANRRGKGTHRAVLRYQGYTHRFRFALKMDIRKYFPSIDHALLKRQLARVFKEPELLSLMGAIIDRGEVPEPHAGYFPGDDLFTPYERPKGLPIGNLTSQLWANTYLSGFDHWVGQDLSAPAYLRFVDDFILLHDCKTVLAEWVSAIRRQLERLRLSVHPRKCVIRRTAEGVPFLGYVVWPDRVRVRGATVRRYRKRWRRLQVSDPVKARQSRAAWQGHIQLAGTWRRRTLH